MDLSVIATEDRNPRSSKLHRKKIPELVRIFLDEEAHVRNALDERSKEIIGLVRVASRTLIQNGRLFYVGAGTSGRLGVLDATEMPPTFGVSTDLVQGIIAGGSPALLSAVEGAEDSIEAGKTAIQQRGISQNDMVIGIAASGRTPFVLSALAESIRLKASTGLLTCNPRFIPDLKLDAMVALPTGPELITGSTRLKAGTATKIVLNMISSIAMIQMGKVHDNLMINVQATNEKLKARAIRLACTLFDVGPAQAETQLKEKNWDVAQLILDRST